VVPRDSGPWAVSSLASLPSLVRLAQARQALAGPRIAHFVPSVAPLAQTKPARTSSSPQRTLYVPVTMRIAGAVPSLSWSCAPRCAWQYNRPIRVLALNVEEGWVRDVSQVIAAKVRDVAWRDGKADRRDPRFH